MVVLLLDPASLPEACLESMFTCLICFIMSAWRAEEEARHLALSG